MTFFSIIIPTFNRAGLIVSTINSVLKQNYNDFEIIVVDDGSTDSTKEVILKKIGRNSNIKYYHQENSERGAARNYGVQKATGEYIVFLDSDDIMHQNHLTVLFSIIKNNPEINFLASKYNIQRKGKKNILSVSEIKEGWYDYTFFLKGNPLAVNFCIKKNNPKLHTFTEDRNYAGMEDWMFLLQNLLNDKIYIADPVTVTLNDHDNRSMRNNKDIIQKKILANQWIKENIKLTENQKMILDGYSDFFCSVHSYADNNRQDALRYLKKSMKKTGITSASVVQFIKILLGYNFIQRLK